MGLGEVQQLAQNIYEKSPIIVTGMYVVLWIVVGLGVFIYLFNPEKSGSKLIGGAQESGLVAVQVRGVDNPIPPQKYIRLAKKELVITGISAYRTFDQYIEVIKETLTAGVDVYVIIMDPDSSATKEISNIEKKNVSVDILQTVDNIKQKKLNQFNNFYIKFSTQVPSYTAVMVDGDINSVGAKSYDEGGKIRVQPRSLHGLQDQGVILQFENNENKGNGFAYFSADLRKQWLAAIKKPDLL